MLAFDEIVDRLRLADQARNRLLFKNSGMIERRGLMLHSVLVQQV